jgi:two-component system KDP operon response regulator KdpE
MLLQQVWGSAYGDEAHYLHVYVARLRKKLEPDPQAPRYIGTEPGVGYRLLAD